MTHFETKYPNTVKNNSIFNKKTTFRFIIAFSILTIVSYLLTCLITYRDTSKYNTIAKVFSVSEDGTQFVDGAGYVWEVSDTDYTENTFVEISFDNNGTDNNRLDDIIISVKPQRNLNKRVSIVEAN